MEARRQLSVEIVAGPDRRPATGVGDRIVIGRSAECSVVVDDPTIGGHHLIVDVDRRSSGGVGDGATIVVTSLDGSSPVRVDGRPVTGPTPCRSTSARWRVRVGASELLLRLQTPLACSSVTGRPSPNLRMLADGRLIVERPFAVEEHAVPDSLDAPCSPAEVPAPPATGLIGAGIGAIGSLILATVLGSPVFAVFAMVGATASLATWGVARWQVRRRRRSDSQAWRESLAAFEDSVRTTARRAATSRRRTLRGVSDLVQHLGESSPTPSWSGLWAERLDPARRTTSLIVGHGTVGWQPTLADGGDGRSRPDADVRRIAESFDRLTDVPVSVEFGPGRCVALTGRHRDSLLRAVVLQLAWRLGPAEWRLVVEGVVPAGADWMRDLPHAAASGPTAGGGPGASLAHQRSSLPGETMADQTRSPLDVVVVDISRRPEPTAAIRRHLAAGRGVVVVAERAPAVADVDVHGAGDGHLTVNSRGPQQGAAAATGAPIDALLVGIGAPLAMSAARRMSGLVDPEVDLGVSVPNRCSTREVHEAADDPVDPHDTESVLEAWSRAGTDPAPRATIGRHADGLDEVDLERDGPHVLVAGSTGSGKSELLRSLIVGLAVRSRPDLLAVIGVDYKGGAAFDAVERLPHVLGVITDLDAGLAERALVSLDAELRSRARRFREVGASDLHAFRDAVPVPDPPVPRLVVVVDEFATLAADVPEFLGALIDVARRGRSLGIHLVLATQRPGGVVDDDIRANTALRIALRTEHAMESSDVVGVPDAASISRATPGRFVRRLDGGMTRLVQTASTSIGGSAGGPSDSSLDEIVGAVVAAAAARGLPRIGPPWTPALADRIEVSDLVSEFGGSGGDVESPRHPPSGEAPGPAGSGDTATGDTGPRGERIDAGRIIGVIDDPARQCRRPLRRALGAGSLAIVAGPGGGATSALLSIGASVAAEVPVDRLALYVVDARGDRRLDAFESLAHCGGVIRPADTERFRRLLLTLAQPSHPHCLLLIDGLDLLRDQLRHGDDPELDVALRDVLLAGRDRGIDVVATSRVDAFPPGRPADETWVGATTDLAGGRSVGWTGPPLPAIPGRVGIVSSGLVAQLVAGAPGLAELPARPEGTGAGGATAGGGPAPIIALPADLDLGEVSVVVDGPRRRESTMVAIGRRVDDLGCFMVDLAPGRHVAVVGRPGGGVSTALDAFASAWRAEGRAVVEVAGSEHLGSVERALDQATSSPVLVVVDEAHRVDDDGTLTRLIEQRTPRGTIVAGLRADAVRTAYGHWTRALLSVERGLALTPDGEPPTDVWNVAAPRRPLVAARPGLGWWFERGRLTGVQIARRRPEVSPPS